MEGTRRTSTVPPGMTCPFVARPNRFIHAGDVVSVTSVWTFAYDLHAPAMAQNSRYSTETLSDLRCISQCNRRDQPSPLHKACGMLLLQLVLFFVKWLNVLKNCHPAQLSLRIASTDHFRVAERHSTWIQLANRWNTNDCESAACTIRVS